MAGGRQRVTRCVCPESHSVPVVTSNNVFALYVSTELTVCPGCLGSSLSQSAGLGLVTCQSPEKILFKPFMEIIWEVQWYRINLNSDYTMKLIVFYHACSIVSCFSVLVSVVQSGPSLTEGCWRWLLLGLVRSHNIREVNNGNGITNTIVPSYNSNWV